MDEAKARNDEALRHLLRFESAVVAAARAGADHLAAFSVMLVREAEAATALASLPCVWRSRPQALAAVAEKVCAIKLARGIGAGDVETAMKAIEASWELDPDVRLGQIPGELREPFDLWLEELSERAR